jgi:hypothetical protein
MGQAMPRGLALGKDMGLTGQALPWAQPWGKRGA